MGRTLAGFQVICGVRNMEKANRQLAFPGVKLLKIDMNKDLDSDVWLARLKEHDIDVVVNNVGIVNSFGDQSLENVNVAAPMALFKAMQSYHRSQKSRQGGDVLRVIQISTTGVDWPDCHEMPYPASNKEWLRATGQQPIRLEDIYREYKKGTKAYNSFIQSIRDGSF